VKLIQTLNDKIAEEIHDAQSYATMALELKDERKSLADVLYQLSAEEMKHMSMLHNEAVKIIDEFRKTKGEPPAPMMAVYDYLHKKHIEQAKEAKLLQSMYKE
jgi:rubrerythrin